MKLKLGFTFALLGLLQGCGISFSTPFKQLASETDMRDAEDIHVVVTYAEVRPDKNSAELFSNYLDSIVEGMDSQPGLYGYSLRKELFGNRAWTMSLWRGEQAISDFRASEFHLPAMIEGPRILKSATFARAKVKPVDVPLSWDYALQLLSEQGRVYDYSAAESIPSETLENAD